MNCSLLGDEDYVNDITEKIPSWLAKGHEEYYCQTVEASGTG